MRRSTRWSSSSRRSSRAPTRTLKPDPGRVTARRLNRAEYTNTIRDLLAVDFRADKNFPTDDSGEGFDNIADVLTVSPVLMEKYLSAAARIARARGGAPSRCPNLSRSSTACASRTSAGSIRATSRPRTAWTSTPSTSSASGCPGQRRRSDAKPVTLGLWLDGKLIHTMLVETKPSGLVYFNPYSEEKIRVPLPEGDHTLRLGFIDDDFVKTLGQTGHLQATRSTSGSAR